MLKLKATKMLIRSIISFVVSLILCVGACLAWYSLNSKVSGENMNAEVREGDIIHFSVTAHYLNTAQKGYSKAKNGNVTVGLNTITVDYGKLGVLETEDDDMRPYGGLFNNFATAILLEVDYELAKSSTNYRISASCPLTSSLAITVEGEGADKKYISALSNAVGYYDVNVSDDEQSFFKADSIATTFVKNENKSNKRFLKSGIIPNNESVEQGKLQLNEDGNVVGKEYYILDYMPEQFIYLSTLIIKSGGNLNSSLSFFGDLELNIESYDPATVPKPVSIELANPAETRVEQEAGEDIISNGWSFIVTYTDGTTEMVGKSDVTMGQIETTTVGNKTATISYTEDNVTVECEVEYTINEKTSQTIEVTSVTLNNSSLSLTVGGTSNLVATVKPANAANKSVTWSSSDSSVASVSSNGVVTAKAAGTTTITATSNNGKTATCEVTVSPQPEYTVTFNLNGHGTSTTATTENGKVSAPAEPAADGYTFGGWYENEACTGNAVNFTTKTFASDTTLYAKWTENAAGGALATISGFDNTAVFDNDGNITIPAAAQSYVSSITAKYNSSKANLYGNDNIKLQSSTIITFVVTQKVKIKLTLTNATTVNVDNSSYTVTNGTVEFELTAGTHALTKGSGEARIASIEIIAA